MKGYELLERLSSSSEGNPVFKAKRPRGNGSFAIKQISYVNIPRPERNRMVETTNTLIQLAHQSTGLIDYHNTEVDTDNGIMYIVMNYYEKNLEQMLCEAKHPIDKDTIWSIVSEVATALYDCHFNKPSLAHGALTPDHIFFDDEGYIKIGCFALNSCPEVDREEDLKNLGAIVYRMATLQPFVSKKQISSSDSTFRHLDHGIRKLILGLLDPVDRLTIPKLLEIPEISLKAIEKKIKLEKEMYRREKEEYLEREADIERREKLLGVEKHE